MRYRNASTAFVGKLAQAMNAGDVVEVRGNSTRELRYQLVELDEPLERAVVIPHRHNNIFATIAETMWVLAGRDDLSYLLNYLPRAIDFSDDGRTWRGAYGPRLRNWQGVDQVAAVVQALRAEPSTRRAVMSIFDPARDFESSLDIPCTNWLQASVRNGLLDLSVTVRSNDLFWGFSGINAFEWSVLQEMLAFWTDTKVGKMHYFVSSLHVYERHWSRSTRILNTVPSTPSPSDARSEFGTKIDDFSDVLANWFRLEGFIRSGEANRSDLRAFPDPLLRDFLLMLNAFWAFDRGDNGVEMLADVNDQDLVLSARDYFAWRSGQDAAVEPGPTSPTLSSSYLRDAISALHAAKDSVYGDSWKRRGEQMSVIANIARKVDRLVIGDGGGSASIEPEFDNAADLLVYAVKYETYLADATSTRSALDNKTWSDGTSGFDQLVAQLRWELDSSTNLQSRLTRVTTALDTIEQSINRGDDFASRRLPARKLTEASLQLFLAVAARDSEQVKLTTGSWILDAEGQL